MSDISALHPLEPCPVSGQTRREETVNALLHGLGLLLGIGGVAVLIVLGALYGSAWHVVGFSVYGASLVLVYGASTIYHGTRRVGPKRVLRYVDHATIFLLIAGTYTPFTLVPLNGPWGWSLFGVVWGLSVVGLVTKLFIGHRFALLSTLTYLVLGWIVIVAIVPLWEALPVAAFVWLVAGGIVYSLGTVFYLKDDLPFFHAVWHVFVLGGSVCHYVAVLFCLQFVV